MKTPKEITLTFDLSVCSGTTPHPHFKPLKPNVVPTSFITNKNNKFLNETIKYFLKNNEATVSITLEYSLHKVPVQYRSELKLVFPDLVNKDIDIKNVLIIPTFQQTVHNLISSGKEEIIQNEKDLMLHRFFLFSITFCLRLQQDGYFADFCDPASGYAVLNTRGPSYYPDVHAAQRLLSYETMEVAGCAIIKHPKWGTNVYPATLFTNASKEKVEEILKEMCCVYI